MKICVKRHSEVVMVSEWLGRLPVKMDKFSRFLDDRSKFLSLLGETAAARNYAQIRRNLFGLNFAGQEWEKARFSAREMLSHYKL